MKFIADFFPIILFFIAYKFYGIFTATAVAIAASAAQVAWMWFRHHRVENMQMVTLGLLVVFGGMTITLRDPIFVMWKPTIVNWLFAVVFLATQFIGDSTLVERMMRHAIDVPGEVWRRLNLMWIGFFLFSGLANLYVVYVGSGFYETQQALVTAAGLTETDLSSCAEQFTGKLFDLCQNTKASEETWVNFKLFGMMGMTILFVIAQGFYLARHIHDEEQPAQAD